MAGQTTLLVGIVIAVLTITVNCNKILVSGVCDLRPDTGLCRGYFPRYFYNANSGKCEQFVYGGCGGNSNNFNSLFQCQQSCIDPGKVCNASPDKGPCRAYFPVFFYNSTSGKCEQFVYGGCGGNDNRFSSEQQCLNKCVCSLPPKTGPCRASIPAFYYNVDRKRCESFTYGGCGGNGNRFSSAATCKQTCGGR